MPTTVAVRKFVPASRDRVFAVASNFPEAARTMRAIQSVEMLTPGPVGPGTRFKETRVMFGRPASETMTVREFLPPERYSLIAESHGSRYDFAMNFRDVPGGTELELTFVATPLTLVAKIFGALLAGFMRKHMVQEVGKDLDDLAAAAVARAA